MMYEALCAAVIGGWLSVASAGASAEPPNRTGCLPHFVTTGTCTSPVRSAEECSRLLEMDYPHGAKSQEADDRPHGCWYQPGGHLHGASEDLYFNTPPVGVAAVECSQAAQCVCCAENATDAAAPAARCELHVQTSGRSCEAPDISLLSGRDECTALARLHAGIEVDSLAASEQAERDRPAGCWWQPGSGGSKALLFYNTVADSTVNCSDMRRCICCGSTPTTTTTTWLSGCMPQLVGHGEPFSASCPRPYRNASECEAAIAAHPQLGRGGILAAVQIQDVGDRPQGCWHQRAWHAITAAVFFNSATVPQAQPAQCTDARPCVCCGETSQTIPDPVCIPGLVMDRSRCERPARSQYDCDFMAEQLGLGIDLPLHARLQVESNLPEGCWLQEGHSSSLFYNQGASSTAGCSADRKCLCCLGTTATTAITTTTTTILQATTTTTMASSITATGTAREATTTTARSTCTGTVTTTTIASSMAPTGEATSTTFSSDAATDTATSTTFASDAATDTVTITFSSSTATSTRNMVDAGWVLLHGHVLSASTATTTGTTTIPVDSVMPSLEFAGSKGPFVFVASMLGLLLAGCLGCCIKGPRMAGGKTGCRAPRPARSAAQAAEAKAEAKRSSHTVLPESLTKEVPESPQRQHSSSPRPCSMSSRTVCSSGDVQSNSEEPLKARPVVTVTSARGDKLSGYAYVTEDDFPVHVRVAGDCYPSLEFNVTMQDWIYMDRDLPKALQAGFEKREDVVNQEFCPSLGCDHSSSLDVMPLEHLVSTCAGLFCGNADLHAIGEASATVERFNCGPTDCHDAVANYLSVQLEFEEGMLEMPEFPEQERWRSRTSRPCGAAARAHSSEGAQRQDQGEALPPVHRGDHSGPFDGVWIHKDRPDIVEIIMGGTITSADGSDTQIFAIDSNSFYIELEGHRLNANLRGGVLHWGDGDIWYLKSRIWKGSCSMRTFVAESSIGATETDSDWTI